MERKQEQQIQQNRYTFILYSKALRGVINWERRNILRQTKERGKRQKKDRERLQISAEESSEDQISESSCCALCVISL